MKSAPSEFTENEIRVTTFMHARLGTLVHTMEWEGGYLREICKDFAFPLHSVTVQALNVLCRRDMKCIMLIALIPRKRGMS